MLLRPAAYAQLLRPAAPCCRRLAGPRAWLLPPGRRPLSHAPPDRSSSSSSSTTTTTIDSEGRTWSTPLAKQLAEAISATGPMPVASFMRMCLTGDLGGYYTGGAQAAATSTATPGTATPARDPFGASGDFVTSPEVSQVFGELVGIWFVAEWLAQGRPARGVELIEVGPGRGTLMADVLRTVRHFGAFARSIDAVHLVEASAPLRATQAALLCEAPPTETALGWQGVAKHGGMPVVWTETIQALPKRADSMPLIVAHEFFDALPIHIFQSVVAQDPSSSSSSSSPPSTPSSSLQWREMVVTPTPPGSTHESLGTPRSLRPHGADTSTHPVPDFQLTLAPGPTRHARYLPALSPRYRRLLQAVPQGGAVLEVCPDAALYAAEFAVRIGGSSGSSPSGSSSPSSMTAPKLAKPRPSGAALIVDYGPGDGSVPVNSLRGIRRHRLVSPFAEPGRTDLSADVDFAALAEAALQASDGVEVHGPVDQADFLLAMGLRERAQALAKAATGANQAAAAAADDVERACQRLVDRGPNGMGKVYKVLAIVPENDGRRRPVGFGGDVGPM